MLESYEYSKFKLQKELIEEFIRNHFNSVYEFLHYYGLSLIRFNQFMAFDEFDMINYEVAKKVAQVLDLELNELYKKI